MFGRLRGKRVLESEKKYREMQIEKILNHAEVSYKQNEFKLALIDCEEALKLAPTHVRALADKARTLYSLGEYKEALNCVNIARNTEPNCALLKYYYGEIVIILGEIEENLGKISDAYKLYEEGVHALEELIPHPDFIFIDGYPDVTEGISINAGYFLDKLKEEKNLDQALLLADFIIRLDPEQIEIYDIKGRILLELAEREYKKGNFTKSYTHCENALLSINHIISSDLHSWGANILLKKIEGQIESLNKISDINRKEWKEAHPNYRRLI